jgi:hypothetical protein
MAGLGAVRFLDPRRSPLGLMGRKRRRKAMGI